MAMKGYNMKQIFVVVIGLMLLGGCASSVTENRESRSTVYEGQTTWDLYENFGVPSRALQTGPNEFQFYYHKEAITRDWTRMYYDYCDTVFVVVDDRVVDWDQTGNQCYINVAEGVRDTSGRLTEEEDTGYYDETAVEDGYDADESMSENDYYVNERRNR